MKFHASTMKCLTILSTILALVSTIPASASDSAYIRHIREVSGSYVTKDFPVGTGSGEILSEPQADNLSIFQLFATYTKADGNSALVKLDEKAVGTYLPTVTLTAFSEDPHIPTRTRADQPYGITISIARLPTEPEAPAYAKAIYLKRDYQLFSPVTYAPSGVRGFYSKTLQFTADGTSTENGIYQALPDGTPTQAMGMERFTASIRLPVTSPSEARLASAEITVWPVGAAQIHGIKEGKGYSSLPESVYFTLLNAYPKSKTYAQIYAGEPTLGTKGKIIGGTTVSFDAEIPQHAQVPIEFPLDPSLFNKNQRYTIEILSETPFKNGVPERLAHVSFFLDLRLLKINASMSSLD